MDVEISGMKKADLEKVASVFLTTFNAAGEHWSDETSKQHVKENYFGKCHYVAKIDDKIVGFLMAIPLTREKGKELFIDSIAVLPKYQGQGIGKKLWEKATEYVAQNKLAGIRFLSHPKLPSFEWYKRMGYKKSGWTELYKTK